MTFSTLLPLSRTTGSVFDDDDDDDDDETLLRCLKKPPSLG